MPYILGFFLAFPVFFTKDFRVFSGGLGSYEFSLPISFFVAAFFFVLNFFSVVPALSGVGALLFLSSSFSIAVFSSVFLWGGDFSLLGLYFAPAIFGFFLPWAARLKSNDISSVIYGFVGSIWSAAALHLAASFYEFGFFGAFVERGVDSVFGFFSIYQKFIYYSTLLAVACFFVFVYVRGWLKFLLCIVLSADLVLIGAREALLLLMVFFVSADVILKRGVFLKFIYFGFNSVLMAMLFLIFYCAGQVLFPDAAIIAKLATLFGADGGAGDMSAGRIYVASSVVSSFDIDFIFWFFGSGFSTVDGSLGTPHNQYIEWFLRGGVFFLFFNLCFLIAAIFYAFVSRDVRLVSIGVVLLVVFLFSNNINTPFRAPYASVFLWFLVGVVFKFSMEARSSFASGSVGRGCVRLLD